MRDRKGAKKKKYHKVIFVLKYFITKNKTPISLKRAIRIKHSSSVNLSNRYDRSESMRCYQHQAVACILNLHPISELF
jgi:hypothetical protein